MGSAFDAASETFARLVDEGQKALVSVKEQESDLHKERAQLQAERKEFEDEKKLFNEERCVIAGFGVNRGAWRIRAPCVFMWSQPRSELIYSFLVNLFFLTTRTFSSVQGTMAARIRACR